MCAVRGIRPVEAADFTTRAEMRHDRHYATERLRDDRAASGGV